MVRGLDFQKLIFNCFNFHSLCVELLFMFSAPQQFKGTWKFMPLQQRSAIFWGNEAIRKFVLLFSLFNMTRSTTLGFSEQVQGEEGRLYLLPTGPAARGLLGTSHDLVQFPALGPGHTWEWGTTCWFCFPSKKGNAMRVIIDILRMTIKA